MVEVANFVGSGRDVLVVVSDIQGESPVISGDVLTPREVEDLNRGREFVRTVSETAGNLVESSVHRAVSSLLDVSVMMYTCHSIESNQLLSRFTLP